MFYLTDTPLSLHQAGTKLSDGTNELDLAKIPADGVIDSPLKLSDVKVEGTDGLDAPSIPMSKTFRSPKENLVPKASQTAHIKGTLEVVKIVDKELEIVGSKVGVVNTVNGEDIAGIHDNCAWLEAPLSLAETLNSDSTITFAENTEFYDTDITDDVTVKKINGQDYSKYVKVDPDMKYNVGGKKTFGTGSSASKITAKSFNGLTLDQLITKKSPQEISGTSTFNAAVTADKISAGVQDAPPTIDGETLSSLISKVKLTIFFLMCFVVNCTRYHR